MMKELVENFPQQLQEALEIGENAKLTSMPNTLLNVLITGMGGSGIGGIMASELTAHESKIPMGVSDSYTIPKYVNENTLVIVSSYSGDTEETLQSLEYAEEQGAKIVCIASGGKLIQKAIEKGLDHIVIPGGMPPRACVGYSLVQIFYILNFYGIIGDGFKDDIKASILLLRGEQENIQSEAKEVAKVILNKVPVLYSSYGFEGVSIFWRRNLNENAKILNWHSMVPEMNHNELVGWAGGDDNIAVVFLRNHTDNPRIQKRMEVSKEIIDKQTKSFAEVFSKGESDIERVLYLSHVGAWVSVFLAQMKGVDPDEINSVKYLKQKLENF